ncbi:aldose epimerase family protein [Edaphobacter sp. 12200R-103]|uniref:aldose epimerase family protein n=1 Tax=Edaphobacter sp. 12200R-103 TaxID=2703788 RepID=UPI001EE48B34|nr:aldose epimerase family protein [Edaphobacter sp. 12200R-103]
MAMVAEAGAAVTKAGFGKMPDGTAVDLYTLKSDALEVKVMTYGARIVAINTADKNGKVGDVVLGYDKFPDYLADKKTYFGAIVGRYGNRIAHGEFKLDGKTYDVPKNDNGINSLHGGTVGFDQHVWTGKEVPGGVEMTLVSKDGDQGFPGTLTAHVTYTVHGNTLRIDYSESTDKDTVVNLTNHSYFNLGGVGSGTILDEEIAINADHFTPTDKGLIPTGELAKVDGTPMDFRKATAIGKRIHDNFEPLKLAGGYDHNWVLNGENGQMKLAARVHDLKSGRVMTVETTEPGVQFYTGNFLDGSFKSPSGWPYAKNTALCLETQHFPDSPNHPSFPSTELKPGQTRHSTTTFTFTTQK